MNVGDKLPEILGVDQNGKEVKSTDLEGTKVLLYFYPKDGTSGCTAEAISFRDNFEKLSDEGYKIIGVSPDSPQSHLRFIEKNSLPFQLISDTGHRLAEEMGVWGEKSMYGRKYFGILRTTFLVDEKGVITKIFQPKEIKTKEHACQILNAVNK